VNMMRKLRRRVKRTPEHDAASHDTGRAVSEEVLQRAKEICKRKGLQWDGSTMTVRRITPGNYEKLLPRFATPAMQQEFIEKARLELALERSKKQT
jgi:hypothetical protein